mgnify:FL=1
MQQQRRNLVLMLVIGILIGTSAIMVWNLRSSEKRMQYDSSTPIGEKAVGVITDVTPALLIAPSSPSFPLPPSIPLNTRVGLSVPDQPAGKTIAVQDLSITGTKWVAIYDDRDGKPGRILGATRVHDGNEDATVDLLRPEGTISGGTYYAAILNDDGDEEFNRLTDLPPLSPDKVTIVRFIVK